jgi:hypothetical protein
LFVTELMATAIGVDAVGIDATTAWAAALGGAERAARNAHRDMLAIWNLAGDRLWIAGAGADRLAAARIDNFAVMRGVG